MLYEVITSVDRIAADQRRTIGTCDVILDRFSLHGSGNLFFKCRNDRLGTGGLAFGGHPGCKPGCGHHHAPAAKRMAGERNPADAQGCKSAQHSRIISYNFV